jgi:hypothetical protein
MGEYCERSEASAEENAIFQRRLQKAAYDALEGVDFEKQIDIKAEMSAMLTALCKMENEETLARKEAPNILAYVGEMDILAGAFWARCNHCDIEDVAVPSCIGGTHFVAFGQFYALMEQLGNLKSFQESISEGFNGFYCSGLPSEEAKTFLNGLDDEPDCAEKGTEAAHPQTTEA